MTGVRDIARETIDRAVASDPGLPRLRAALSAGVAMASTLAVEFGFSQLTHAPAQATVISMLLGTVVAMIGSTALSGSRVWPKVGTAAFFPVAIGAGMTAGIAVADNTDLMLVGFVVVMFIAVFIRRFGIPFFFYGFMSWLGYFFASFMHATWAALPALIAAVAVASVWVLLLSLTVLRTHPGRTLRRTLYAFRARGRGVLRAVADLLEETPADQRHRDRALRRLHTRQIQLAEAALMIEGVLADESALSTGWSASALRRRLLDMQLAIDTVAGAAEALAQSEHTSTTDDELTTGAAEAVDRLARREDHAAERAARKLAHVAAGCAGTPETPGWWPARHLADAVLELLALARQWDTPPEETTPEEETEFEPAVTLMMGNLPGSASVAGDVEARGRRWNLLARLDLTTRQALQVALAGGLAILVGRELSEQRYYWAVIAAFVMFTGTATRSETVTKGFNRVAGTMVGLFAGVALAHLTAGHTLLVLVVVVLSMMCGFYLMRISYAFMIFFVTIMVAQLYTVLNEFSPGLLVLRLEETAIGAAIGMVVALVFVPLSTRDTVRTARANLLTALGELLGAVAARIDPDSIPADEDTEETEAENDEADDSGGIPGFGRITALGKAVGHGGVVAFEKVVDLGRTVGRTIGGGTSGTDDDADTGDADGAEDDDAGPADLDALARAVDHRRQQLTLVARPLTRPLLWGNSPRLVNHRLIRYTAATTHARALAIALRHPPEQSAPHLAAACRSLAEATTALAETPSGQRNPDVATALNTADHLLFTRPPVGRAAIRHPATRPLIHLYRLLVELGDGTAADAPLEPGGTAATTRTALEGDQPVTSVTCGEERP